MPSGTTFGRHFKHFSQQENTRVFTAMNEYLLTPLKFDNYTLGVDSSVMTRYGLQEGAKRG